MDLPGDRIRAIRKKAGYSLRELAARCDPPMDYTTVGRIERGLGYTGDSLERFAKVLDCCVSDFFLPEQLAQFPELSNDEKEAIAKYINAFVDARRYRSA